MKNIFSLIILSGCLIQSAGSFAQCEQSALFKTGTKLEMRSFNEKDKLQSISNTHIKSVSNTDKGTIALMSTEVLDAKSKPVSSGEVDVRCQNGVFFMNMRSFMDAATMKGYEGMDVKIDAGELELPSSMNAGQTLNDGKLVMTINGPFPMTNTIDITNRKVEGRESRTTPAGTFECYKLTYDVGMKMMVKVTSKVEEWYSPEVGTVESRTFDKNGKLTGYTQLTSLTK